jgi:predicted trehalose synthase
MNKIGALVEEIEATLAQEKKSYADGDESDENIQGWIEALQYVLRQIEYIVE